MKRGPRGDAIVARRRDSARRAKTTGARSLTRSKRTTDFTCSFSCSWRAPNPSSHKRQTTASARGKHSSHPSSLAGLAHAPPARRMAVPDALIGRVLLVAITAAFAYATVWLFAVVRAGTSSSRGALAARRLAPCTPPPPHPANSSAPPPHSRTQTPPTHNSPSSNKATPSSRSSRPRTTPSFCPSASRAQSPPPPH